MTGETQLRARRTRLKILRAIAEKNGSAGFSEIRDATGLSTGSIYYHLERMDNYVSKDYKHYVITEVGLQLLREVDSKGSEPTNEDRITLGNHQIDDAKSIDESGNVVGFVRENVFILVALVIVGSLSFVLFSQLYNINPPAGPADAGKMIANATIMSSLSIAGLLSASFLVMLKRRMIPTGYRGIMLSTATVLAVILVNILIFTGLVAQIGLSPSISYAGKMIANATIMSSLSIAGLLSASFLVMLKRRMIPTGYRGIMLSTATVLAVILVNILIFTGLVAQIGIAQFTY